MSSKRIGTQLARIKFGRDYLSIFTTILSAVSLVILALAAVGVQITLQLYLSLIIGAFGIYWLVGFVTEVSAIKSEDMKRTFAQSIEGNKVLWQEVYEESYFPQFDERIEVLQKVLIEIKELLKKMTEQESNP